MSAVIDNSGIVHVVPASAKPAPVEGVTLFPDPDSGGWSAINSQGVQRRLGQIYPKAGNFFLSDVRNTGSFPLGLPAADSNQVFNMHIFPGSNPPSTGAEFRGTMLLQAGTYTFKYIGLKNTTYGVGTVYLNGVSIGTINHYAASLQYNQTTTITGVVVATSGLHTIRHIITSAGAGGGFQFVGTCVSMYQV